MNYNFKKIISIVFITLFLSACVTGGKDVIGSAKEKVFNRESDQENNVGLSLEVDNIEQQEQEKVKISEHRNLNIIIPAFDPGIDNDEKVFQELRNFEARRFAVKLKTALENTNSVGAVRVTPNTSASGQIYVLGKIKESNGYKVKIKIKVIDASGQKILDKDFSEKIDSSHYNNVRTKNIDAYNPLFEKVALKIIKKIEKLKSKRVYELINISNLRFGAEFSPESFKEYLGRKNNKFSLKALPSEDDPMLQRVNSIMIREQLFVDSLQSHYDKFANLSNQSYVLWQGQSYNEIIAERKAKTKALGRGILGALSIAAAVASATAPKNYNDDYSGEVAMLTLGGKLLEDAAKYKAEAKMHRDSIKELGASIDAELAPNVIEFENKTIELSGNAKQQFIEWRKFLKKMYELEKTPDVQL
tara:strand:+ start:1029 stop:2279 length:1251 start_codon:yes stop_codon:yes gene_type:complete